MGVENEAQFRNRDGIIDDAYRIAFISEHLSTRCWRGRRGKLSRLYAVGLHRQCLADERV